MTSLRVSLSILKTLKGVHPGIFKDMVESLLELYEVHTPLPRMKAQVRRVTRLHCEHRDSAPRI
jgi:hypothetical protein